ncbi:MAG: hypothetical protein K2K92_03020, partial [Duncaniella sp.]|nr:hypothetical protein [Duncaniella sp.]
MKTFYSSVSSWLKAASLTAMAAMLAVNVSAQSTRTYWDFTKPLSQETIDNLKADTQNYTLATEHTDKAEAMCWATAKKGTQEMVGEPIMANGVVIKELEGIVFDDLTSMTANNEYFRLGIQTTKFRNECP